MRIGIDARYIRNKFCGAGRVSLNLIKALARNDSKNEYIIYTNDMRNLPIVDRPNFTEKKIGIPMYSLKDHLITYKIVKSDKLDIFHSQLMSFPLLLKISAKKVLTVHDTMGAKYAWFYESHGKVKKHFIHRYFKFLIKKSVGDADVIITVSNFSKDDITDFFNITNDKVKVVYNGVTYNDFTPLSPQEKSDKFKYLKEKYAINKPFILYIGNFKRYKNIKGTLEGYAKYKRNNPQSDVILVIGGNDKNVIYPKALAQKLNINNDVCFINYIDEEDLPIIYAMSKLFIFPSIYEGFGIPPLEAMASGSPVLTSNATALPEVVGDAGILVNPLDTDEIAEKINVLLTDKSLREGLIAKGIKRVRMFSWDNSAISMIKIYESLVSKK